MFAEHTEKAAAWAYREGPLRAVSYERDSNTSRGFCRFCGERDRTYTAGRERGPVPAGWRAARGQPGLDVPDVRQVVAEEPLVVPGHRQVSDARRQRWPFGVRSAGNVTDPCGNRFANTRDPNTG